jgi:gliding motility-associated-like protein
VTLVATSDAGCTDSIRRQVYVYPEPVTAFSVNDSTQCLNGNNFIFNNTSTIATGPMTYSWNFGDNSPLNTSTSPSYVYTSSGTFTVTLIATGNNGCADTTTRNMTVYPKPMLSFNVNDSTQCIGGNSFVFTNTSSISSGTNTYVWYFGDGGSSPLTNPTHTYTSAGSFTVTLVAISDNGCIDSVRRTMLVYPNPTVRFTVNDTTQCIQGNSFVFTNNTSINPVGALTYQWNFGNGANSANTSPTYVYSAPGTYTVTLIANSVNGCVDSFRQTVYVYTMPTGTLQVPASTVICQGSSVTLTATGGASYQWYLGGTAIPGATAATLSANTPGVYTVDIISAQGCVTRATDSVTLTLQVRPRVDFSFDKFCAGFATVFTNLSDISNSGTVSYSWRFGDGGTSTVRNPSRVYATPGTYNVTLVVTPQSCPNLRDSITKSVIILPPPAAVRYPAVNAVKNRDLQLQARPFPQASFNWSPSAGLNNPSLINPIFNFSTEQEYLIRITTPEGCVVIDTQLVRIFDNRDILLPRGFSPNADGKNDKLIPHLVGVTSLRYFRVYDRWGQLIYQTGIIGEGWDGTYKGVKQPMETYVWMAEGVDIDGNVIKRTGKTILLR